MNHEDQRNLLLDFLQSHKLCVVSTSNADNQPSSAVVGFSETDDLKIIFQTPSSTKKCNNIQRNNKVAIAIGWEIDKFTTVQYEGVVHEAYGDEIEWAKNIHISKKESSKKYANLPNNKYFIVEPKWIRYSDLRSEPNLIFEITF